MTIITKQRQREINNKLTSSTDTHAMESVTIGIVADTNDPQQMGRVRAVCLRWGDTFNTNIENIPWATYVTPFGGQTHVGTRGAGVSESKGGIAYGMWAIPKVGAQVLVACIDNDPSQRVYLGCIFDQFTPHTLPHGRYMMDSHPNLDNSISPSGPYTSSEQPIEPLNTNIKRAFGNKSNPNFEWQTRGADYSAAAIDPEHLNLTRSQVVDDKDVQQDDWTNRQGYQTNRQDPNAPAANTARNLDSMVYSLTSPGFHSISMDDRMENCRIRIRTTAGNQIIVDDTNERIYIATANGENWIELDQASGNIDIFTSNKINVRAKQGINLTTDEDFRLHAKNIHMYAAEQIKVQSLQDIHIKTDQNFRLETKQSTLLQAMQEMHLKSSSNMDMTTNGTYNLLASGNIIETAADIHLNGPSAAEANDSQPADAAWTSRVPDHEPWGRVMTKQDDGHEPEFQYTDKNVNRVERGKQITRGLYWRR